VYNKPETLSHRFYQFAGTQLKWKILGDLNFQTKTIQLIGIKDALNKFHKTEIDVFCLLNVFHIDSRFYCVP
jgi:hypothetical protein